MLVLGGLFAAISIAGMIVAAISPSFLAVTVSVVGLAGLVALLIRWWLLSDRTVPQVGQTTILATVDALEVQAPTRSPLESIALIREVVQSRKNLPPPHGVVTSESPQDESSLRELSEPERTRLAVEMRQGLKDHDRQVIEKLKRATEVIGRLPEAQEDAGTQQATGTPASAVDTEDE